MNQEIARNAEYDFWWLMTTHEEPVPLWAGLHNSGYVIIQGWSRARKASIKGFEHRVIMEEWLCRKLSRREIVHHVNFDKLDNRLENLLVCTAKEHQALHAREKHGIPATENA